MKMKIAYLINHQIWRNDGVTKKIAVQVDAWRKEGHTVEVFCITRKLGESNLKSQQYHLGNPIVGRLTKNKELVKDIDTFNPDIVYLRYDLWSVTIAIIATKYCTVAELNTLDVEEYRLLMLKEKTVKSFIRYVAYIIFRGNLFRKLKGLVAVTNEIAVDQSVKCFSLPTAIVPNGIDLKKYTTLDRVNGTAEPLRLFFIATPGQPWHGVDLIVEFAKKLPEMEFHIIGMNGVLEISENSCDEFENLFWHGYLKQEQYISIIKNCHVGIGSLALFRNKMYEACPLKVREYLAYGFPIILGYKDTAFMNEPIPDYVLELDLSEEGVTIDVVRLIREFCLKQQNRIIDSKELLSIDAGNLEQKRLEFFARIKN